MKPCYKGFQDLMTFFYNDYGYNPKTNPTEEEKIARDELSWYHNHTCWLNPPGGYFSKKTKKLCRKYWKHKEKPQLKSGMDLCDMCPNSITYYKDCSDEQDNFLFAMGNSYAYHEQGLMEKW